MRGELVLLTRCRIQFCDTADLEICATPSGRRRAKTGHREDSQQRAPGGDHAQQLSREPRSRGGPMLINGAQGLHAVRPKVTPELLEIPPVTGSSLQAGGLPEGSRGWSQATPPDHDPKSPTDPGRVAQFWHPSGVPADVSTHCRGSPLRCDPRLPSANPSGWRPPLDPESTANPAAQFSEHMKPQRRAVRGHRFRHLPSSAYRPHK